MKILLFEDDDGVGHLTKEALEKHGFTVDFVNRGDLGLKKAENEHFDVFILDQLMPDTSGLAIFEQLKKKQPDCVAVMVTGSGDERIAVMAMKMGVADYIVKSADMEYLSTLPLVIEKAVEQKKFFLEKEALTKDLQKRNEELKTRNDELTAKLEMLEAFEKKTKEREQMILELKEKVEKLEKLQGH